MNFIRAVGYGIVGALVGSRRLALRSAKACDALARNLPAEKKQWEERGQKMRHLAALWDIERSLGIR